MKRAAVYILRRMADRAIDLVGITVAILGLIIAYTAAAETINIVVPVPEVLLPTKLVELIYELGTRCLESCFD